MTFKFYEDRPWERIIELCHNLCGSQENLAVSSKCIKLKNINDKLLLRPEKLGRKVIYYLFFISLHFELEVYNFSWERLMLWHNFRNEKNCLLRATLFRINSVSLQERIDVSHTVVYLQVFSSMDYRTHIFCFEFHERFIECCF